MQNGMDSLGADERNAYVSDFKGFVTYVRDKGFQVYADKVQRCFSATLPGLLLHRYPHPLARFCEEKIEVLLFTCRRVLRPMAGRQSLPFRPDCCSAEHHTTLGCDTEQSLASASGREQNNTFREISFFLLSREFFMLI